MEMGIFNRKNGIFYMEKFVNDKLIYGVILGKILYLSLLDWLFDSRIGLEVLGIFNRVTVEFKPGNQGLLNIRFSIVSLHWFLG